MTRRLSIAMIHRFTPKTAYSHLLNNCINQSKIDIEISMYVWKAEDLPNLPNTNDPAVDVLVTLDSDAQYGPSEIPNIIKPLEQNPSITVIKNSIIPQLTINIVPIF